MEKGRPVISVKNVSMEFQVPLEGSSSLKEYLIKVFTGKNSSRTLKALKNIWLDVYEGEILGVIGTNGSGKKHFAEDQFRSHYPYQRQGGNRGKRTFSFSL